MAFPIKNYKYKIPEKDHPGSFGAIRRYDIHTGVDLYCEFNDEVHAIEDGVVVSVENFTGKLAGSDWWNDTKSVLIKGKSGVILYGEINPKVYIGQEIKENNVVGNVLTVLKKDKGKNPPNMLHIELYDGDIKSSVWWRHNEKKPEKLLDITPILFNEIRKMCENNITYNKNSFTDWDKERSRIWMEAYCLVVNCESNGLLIYKSSSSYTDAADKITAAWEKRFPKPNNE